MRTRVLVLQDYSQMESIDNNTVIIKNLGENLPSLKKNKIYYLSIDKEGSKIYNIIEHKITDNNELEIKMGNMFIRKQKYPLSLEFKQPFAYIPLISFGFTEIGKGLLVNIDNGGSNGNLF